MSVSLKSVGAITLFVVDPQRSKQFYQRVFDVDLLFEDAESAAFKFENMIVNLLARSEAHGLIEPAPVAGQGAGSSFQFSIWVDDTDAACAQLSALGVPLLNGPIDRGWDMRTATFQDPDGHIWELAQQLG
jgi:catechol 2,3-dioxygenase-like lactoylglutathione lyase family enzyme